jgi:hypothetical protein
MGVDRNVVLNGGDSTGLLTVGIDVSGCVDFNFGGGAGAELNKL